MNAFVGIFAMFAVVMLVAWALCAIAGHADDDIDEIIDRQKDWQS